MITVFSKSLMTKVWRQFMEMIKREVLEELRKRYPVGTVVELVRMNDIQAPPVGTKGVVEVIDDMGTIHVKWENGSSLGVVYGEDICRVIG